MEELTIEGCMEMYGAHIKLCIKDYVHVHRHYDGLMRRLKTTKSKVRRNRYCDILKCHDSAEAFLFGGDLEYAINKFSLPLDAEYTKRVVREWARLGRIPESYTNRTNTNVNEDEQ